MKREITVYGNGYSVDCCGNVYGKDGRILKSHKGGNNDYLQVSLSDKGVVKKFLVHRIVALTFLDKIEGKDFVNHKDGDVQNNCLSNLEWVDASENMKHSYYVLGNTKGSAPMTGNSGKDHNKSKYIKIKTPEGSIFEYGSVREMTRETGYSNTAVSMAAKTYPLPYTFKKGINKGMTILEYTID